jgi:hypothetical protein
MEVDVERKDEDGVDGRGVCGWDGWVCGLGAMGVSSIFGLVCRTGAFVVVFPTLFYFQECVSMSQKCAYRIVQSMMWLYVCVRTEHVWSQNFSESGVGSGWRRGGMTEDIYVCENQGWYCLVVLVGGYLLVYFLLDYDVTSGSSEGYGVGVGQVPEGIFLPEKLYYVPGPDGC